MGGAEVEIWVAIYIWLIPPRGALSSWQRPGREGWSLSLEHLLGKCKYGSVATLPR